MNFESDKLSILFDNNDCYRCPFLDRTPLNISFYRVC